MSTNFYLRNKQEYIRSQEINSNIKIKIKEIIEEIKTIVDDEDKVRRIQWDLEESAEVGYEKIHIGKRSVGWKPSFERQEQFSSVKELKDFYYNNKEQYEIVDEYGRPYDWEGLVEELISWNPEGKENTHNFYRDEDGYIWHRYEFS